MTPEAATKVAEQIGTSSVSVQVWAMFIIVGILTSIALRLAFNTIGGLRQELKEQSEKREKLMTNLTEIVVKNSELFAKNIKVLEDNSYTVRRCQETLDKFS